MLSKCQLENVCLCNTRDSKTCRYLYDDDRIHGRYYCHKLRPLDKANIDKKLNQFIEQCKKKGVDPEVSNIPLGDNCSGYPLLKHIEQGYDKD